MKTFLLNIDESLKLYFQIIYKSAFVPVSEFVDYNVQLRMLDDLNKKLAE